MYYGSGICPNHIDYGSGFHFYNASFHSFTSESLIPPLTSPSHSRRRRHVTGEAYRLVVSLKRLFSNLFASSTVGVCEGGQMCD
ncbi:hypothetical protein Ddye_030071 [Dipteronia dyeriana]|uniref:Uncharacterized protein n=1 Tax=Dipteronia dyeriana TaxID=168575 RepID=A0AAD9WL58_9ROSI|nr:hypothetical protein Ddye_030071 [Dipteronia dyeriana]